MLGKKKTGNKFLKGQIMNMINVLDSFENGCKLAAMQDDGVVTKSEEAILDFLNTATEEYRKKLKKISFEENE